MKPIDPLIDSLLATESVAQALELVRRSSRRPADVATLLSGYADDVGSRLPAAAAAARFLCEAVSNVESVQAWSDHDDLSPAVNDLLRRATLARGWPGALATLRGSRDLLDDDVMRSVLAWHTELAGRGVPSTANGAAVVITLGVLLGGTSQGWAHLAWARACESWSARHAEVHFLKASRLMAEYGDEYARLGAATALRSFYERNGVTAAVEIPRETGDARESVLSIPINEAEAYSLRESGRLLEARSLLDETIGLATEFGVAESELRLRILRGLIHDDLGDYALAASDFEIAAERADDVGNAARAFEARNNGAANLLKRGAIQQGAVAFASILRRADHSGNVTERIAARNNLAHARMLAGDPAGAKTLYLEALDLLRDVDGSTSWRIALMGLADALQSLGETDDCRLVTRQFLERWKVTGDEADFLDYWNCAGSDRTDPEIRGVAVAVWESLLAEGDLLLGGSLTIGLARVCRDSGDAIGALRFFDGFLEAFAPIRSFASIAIGIETQAAAIEAGELGAPASAIARLRAAVERVELRLAEVSRPSDGDGLLEEARPLYEALITQLLVAGPHLNVAEAFWLHEASRPMTLTTTLRRAAQQAGESGARLNPPLHRTADSEALRHAVLSCADPRLALISFAEHDGGLSAFVFHADAACIEHVALDVSVGQLQAAASQFSVAVNGDPLAFPPRRPLDRDRLAEARLEDFDEAMNRLGILIATIGNAELVCAVPSRTTEMLPLHAIRAPSGDRLIQRVGVIYQPSVTAFVETFAAAPRAGGERKIFVAGVAAMEDEHPEYFEEDASLLQHLSSHVDVLAGRDASPQRVLTGLREADIIHVASHGFVDLRDPLGSGLLLSDGERRPSRRLDAVPVMERSRYLLTVRQLMNESFGAELLTLRACSTARRAAIAAKEELSTLLRVFGLGGCRTVISAMWNVDQVSSMRLLQDFYTHYLTGGAPAWESLALAARTMIDGGGSQAHVYHWGPFIVSGDWRRNPS